MLDTKIFEEEENKIRDIGTFVKNLSKRDTIKILVGMNSLSEKQKGPILKAAYDRLHDESLCLEAGIKYTEPNFKKASVFEYISSLPDWKDYIARFQAEDKNKPQKSI